MADSSLRSDDCPSQFLIKPDSWFRFRTDFKSVLVWIPAKSRSRIFTDTFAADAVFFSVIFAYFLQFPLDSIQDTTSETLCFFLPESGIGLGELDQDVLDLAVDTPWHVVVHGRVHHGGINHGGDLIRLLEQVVHGLLERGAVEAFGRRLDHYVYVGVLYAFVVELVAGEACLGLVALAFQDGPDRIGQVSALVVGLDGRVKVEAERALGLVDGPVELFELLDDGHVQFHRRIDVEQVGGFDDFGSILAVRVGIVNLVQPGCLILVRPLAQDSRGFFGESVEEVLVTERVFQVHVMTSCCFEFFWVLWS